MSDVRGAEISPAGNVTRETFLQFVEELDTADQMVAEAVGNRKDVRKKGRGLGLIMSQVDRARKEAQKAGDRREIEDRDFRQYMLWFGKPLGYQGDLFAPDGPELRTRPSNGEGISEHQLNQIDAEGRRSGEAGRNRGENPWSPGTFSAARWDAAWLEGQAAIAATLQSAGALPEGMPGGPQRRRGRPPGSRNRPKPGDASGTSH